ncbi:hypothetical protein [Sphingomonas sp. SUN039]|uniref:hypothetical protein n=1 Tax=Sphingomonas sp. SUN039 TaxID=2937787 RepID=UPI00216487F6|nr:hypothetical protein [Sphingomonas sp. SUN039]UVO55778.1 hypothetical protein M0209_17285 [Sphingomonas sp. SUN039]
MVHNAIPYRAFGVDFQSALALPEMREGNEGTDDPVSIVRAAAARPFGATEIEHGVVAGPQVFWMDVPDVVRLCVTNGHEIAVEIAEHAPESDVRAYLLGSALGALLHQRGLLPLHASAVVIDGQAIAFAGTSGAGKSTIALHLNRRGHPLLCDDICAVDTSGSIPMVWPGLCNLKLWGKTLAAVGCGSDGLEQVLPTLDKYRLPVAGVAPYRPYPLGKLFCLQAGPEGTAARIEPLGGADAAATLIANSFRGQLVSPMGRNRQHFDQCMAVARHCGVSRLTRPWSLDGIDASCARVEDALRTS